MAPDILQDTTSTNQKTKWVPLCEQKPSAEETEQEKKNASRQYPEPKFNSRDCSGVDTNE
jgi:hypothetical protein